MRYDHKGLSSRDDVYAILGDIGRTLSESIEVLVIGGAGLQEYNLKDATKDIDIVCKTDLEKDTILKCAQNNGFEITRPEPRHCRLCIDRIAVKGISIVDLFAREIVPGFFITDRMWDRYGKTRTVGGLIVNYASINDIFSLKLLSHRPGDLEDCIDLITEGLLDYDMIYDEIESQYYETFHLKKKACGSPTWMKHFWILKSFMVSLFQSLTKSLIYPNYGTRNG